MSKRWLCLKARPLGVACAIFGLAFLTACASDGNSGGAITPPSTPAPPPPPPPPPPSVPTASNAEFQGSYNLAAIHAETAFADGGTGQGIKVAVIDSGVDPLYDLQGAVSNDSTDLVPGRGAPVGIDLHATFIAGIIGARFNGFGTIGVAYDSTILSVRADTPGTCTSDQTTSNCTFNDNTLAQGVDYARTHGAKIINLSIGGTTPFSPSFEDALSRAVAAGIIVTASAGNGSAADPDWPGQYAVDPRYAGLVIAVGATDQTNALASYSNKAGKAAAGYMVAPGDNVITGCKSNGACWKVSGTSFSAPEVAGAAALMLQAFPNLTPQQVVHILLTTADDLGAPGVDPVFGNGLLDLAKAFSPIGSMSIPQSGAVAVTLSPIAGASMSGAFGDALQATPALTTVGLDAYQRRYQVNLAGGYRPVRPSLVGAAAQPQVQDAQAVIAANGVRVAFSAGRSHDSLEPGAGVARLAEQESSVGDLNLQVQAGRLSFAAWRGEGGMAPSPSLGAASNAFASLTRPDQAIRAAYHFGKISFAAETGQGERGLYDGLSRQQPSSYALASVGLGGRRWGLWLSGGHMNEPQGPLGSWLPDATTFAMPAQTEFATLHADWAASRQLTLSAEAGLGRTRMRSALMDLTGPIISSAWRLSARTGCGDGRRRCTHFGLDLSQPVRVESGTFSTVLADIPSSYSDPLNFSRRSFSAAPSGREIDLRFGVDRDLPQIGWVQLQLVAAREPDNIAAAPVSVGVLANWSARF